MQIVAHPVSTVTSMRCWGLQKVAEFSMAKCPFVLARDNLGFVAINVKTYKAYQICKNTITANLFGHGDILKVIRIDEKRSRVLTVYQNDDSESAVLCNFLIGPEFNEALMILCKQ